MFSKQLFVKLTDIRKEFKDISFLTPLKGPILSRLIKYSSEDECISLEENSCTENCEPAHQEEYTTVDEYDCNSSDDDMSTTCQEKVPYKTEFEQEIEKNREERLALLKSLEILQVKENFLNVINSPKPKKVKTDNVQKTPIISRKSRRIRGLNAEKDVSYVPVKNFFASQDIYDSYIEDVCVTKNRKGKKINYELDVINRLNLTMPSMYLQVIPTYITSLTWCPRPDNMVIAVGGWKGNISIWNVESRKSPYNFTPSSKAISHLQFNPWDPTQLLISDYEELKSADMFAQTVKTIYSCEANKLFGVTDALLHFDFISKSTYIAANQIGSVSIIDERTNKISQKGTVTIHDCNSKKYNKNPVNTVSVHPLERNVFITSSNARKLCLWDLRMLQPNPLSEFGPDLVPTAYFSPVTGNSILATEKGTSFLNTEKDAINLFDSQDFTNITCKNRQKYNCIPKNNYRKYLPEAIWLPNSEKYFAFSNTDTIYLYDDNMHIVKTLKQGNLGTFLNINSFHPFQPALAVGISFSKVAVFK